MQTQTQKMAANTYAELDRLRASNADLLAALQAVAELWSDPKGELSIKPAVAVQLARAAIAKAQP